MIDATEQAPVPARHQPASAPRLVLGSSSPYRRELLERLGLAFSQASPQIDESARPGESAARLVTRLAREKAAAIMRLEQDAWVLASDQVAVLDDQILGKPGTPERAREQLARCSGRPVRFLTSVCLARGSMCHEALDETEVRFRALGGDEIARYVERERPLACAGSFRAEGLGIALFEAMVTRDPTAIIGLPMITVAGMLREAGFAAP